MGRLLNIVTPLHKRTTRDYIRRMTDDKVSQAICKEVSSGRLSLPIGVGTVTT